MKTKILTFFTFLTLASLVWSCQHQLDADSEQGLVILSEISNDNHSIMENKSETNWIPGNLFQDVTADYIVFPRNGILEISEEGAYFIMSMVPFEFSDFTGVAPERSYKVIMQLNHLSVSQDGIQYSIKCDNTPGTVNFDTANYCIISRNSVSATISISGELSEKSKTQQSVQLSGNANISLKLSAGETINLSFKELDYYSK